MLCNKCGTEISEGKRFCKNCGWEDPICSDKEKHEIPVLSIEQVYSGNNNAVMQEVKNKDKLEGTQQSEEKTKPLKSTQKSSDKVKCSNCGAEILPSTAEKYGGWCAPCNRSPQLARERASRESTMEQSDFTNTAVNNGDIVATLLPIPRDFVEHPSDITRDELDGIVGGFAARCVKEGMLRKITLSISGYDNDPRELYEIPEVCAWARDTVKLFPSMPLFLDEDSRYRFVGWVCGPLSRDELESHQFLKRYQETWLECLDEAGMALPQFLRKAGASDEQVSTFYLQEMRSLVEELNVSQREPVSRQVQKAGQRILSRMSKLVGGTRFNERYDSVSIGNGSSNKKQDKAVCDLCGRTFNKKQLDKHFVKTATEAAMITGVIWTGILVTFDENGKAWCPYCFRDAESMRHGGRTVHFGMKNNYLPQPLIGISYECKCGLMLKFDCRSVNIHTGLEVKCSRCAAVMFVPPTIFDHSKYWPQGQGASLRPDYLEQMKFRG